MTQTIPVFKLGMQLKAALQANNANLVAATLEHFPQSDLSVDDVAPFAGRYSDRIQQLLAVKRAISIPYISDCVEKTISMLSGSQGIFRSGFLRREIVESLSSVDEPFARLDLFFRYVNSHLMTAVPEAIENLNQSSPLYRQVTDRAAAYLREYHALEAARSKYTEIRANDPRPSMSELLVLDMQMGLAFAMRTKDAILRSFSQISAERSEVAKAVTNHGLELHVARTYTSGSAVMLLNVLQSTRRGLLESEHDGCRSGTTSTSETWKPFDIRWFQFDGEIGQRTLQFVPEVLTESPSTSSTALTIAHVLKDSSGRGCPAVVDNDVRRLLNALNPALCHDVILDHYRNVYTPDSSTASKQTR